MSSPCWTCQCVHCLSLAQMDACNVIGKAFFDGHVPVLQILPDVASWAYNGTTQLRGEAAHIWVFEQR